jgi:hypothetical protein
MRFQRLVIILLFSPLPLVAQITQPDILSFSDTIRRGETVFKSTGDLTFETEVDTAITLVINELMAVNSGFLVDSAGEDDDWFELFNYGDDPVRINNLYFTDEPALPFKWKIETPEELILEQEEHFLIWADGEPEEGYNHASFKLAGEGEYLAIFKEDGTLIDQVYFGLQTTNITYGRYPDAGLTWNYFPDPTPGAANSTPGSGYILPAPSSNLTGGLYSEPVMLALFSDITGARIYYTTDCSDPDSSDLLYQEPVEISTTTIIRARLIKKDALNGPVLTISVLMNQAEYENPVISLVAEPDALYGSSGIISSNNSSVEVPADLEYMEKGRTRYRAGTGIQLFSPKYTMPNSLKLSARSRYGSNWFDYSFFGNENPDKFKRLILRNSGNDNVNKAVTNTHFRDPLIQTIAEQSNRRPMVSGSKPVNVFLNGNYHGLFNLREREDEYYIETHTGVTDNYDFIELEFGYYGNRHVIAGSYSSWEELLSFVDTTGDLSRDEDFHLVEQMVDLDNFTDYWITEVFAGNYDWLSNNVKFWKPENGKWQWLYWDTDHGLGLKYSNYGNVAWNTLYWSLTFSDRAWSNGYNNILIRNLLRNEKYKESFIKRFTQLLSTSLSYNQTKPLLDSMKNLYQNDMMIHAQHWERSMTDWENACKIIDNYLRQRPDTVLTHLRKFFNLQDPVAVSVRVEPPGAGKLSFSGMEISSAPVEGKFFPGMNYKLQYESIPGFYLDKWKPFENTNDSIEFLLTDSMEIVAFFLPSDHSFPIQLTEVYFNNRNTYDAGDWVEFYYYGSDTLHLKGWYITDEDNQVLYIFPENSIVNPGQHFVVTEELERFREIFPESVCCFGNLSHGLSNRSALTLRSGDGENKKTVELMTSSSWPVLPDEGYSIELKSITDATGFGANWEISEDCFGSPGLPNHTSYNFQKPTGKDSVFTNNETHLLGIFSSNDFYSDKDNHSLAGISVKEISGPGQFYIDNTKVVQGELYDPSDLVYRPNGPHTSQTRLIYSFIDKSGQESSDHTLRFNPALYEPRGSRENFRLYPVPAKEFCRIGIPPEHQGPLDFFLFDINGRMLQSIHSKSKTGEFTVELNGVENGIYLYLIKTRSAVVNGKIEVIK